MAIFRCKMCGGDLPSMESASSCICEFCGTEQTIPKVKDENLQGLFNRANILRMKSEFDKAEEIYEKILQSNDSESEAYWGLILCRYGIEYVEDPVTFKRIPTCHRASYDAITADEDYKNALKYADVVQRGIYEAEAKAIGEIQKEILAISQREEPYDVFICYKETGDDGRRTQDSVIANDIYYQLMQEGFKVFYAAITLEDKLGNEYEPYIFSAINTAKVMLVLGTKCEYFNAVWVKNEWSRFLRLMKKDRSKLLIPCYKDMDAYELPEEFAHLQAQDMSKIGFINDIVRGIKKVVVKELASATNETIIVNGSGANANPLLKRAFMSLEDGEFDKADEFCEQVLNIDPENSQAYLVKLMAEQRVKNQDDLEKCQSSFENSSNYQKAYRFGDAELQQSLTGYIEKINNRISEEKYIRAIDLMNNASSEVECLAAAEQFKDIYDYKDSRNKAAECIELVKEVKYNIALKAMESAVSENDYWIAAELFNKMDEYKDSKNKLDECKQAAMDIPYKEAIRKMNSACLESDYRVAASMFRRISQFSNASEMEIKCLKLAENSRKEIIYENALRDYESEEILRIKNAKKEFEGIIDYKDSETKVKECQKKIVHLKRKNILSICKVIAIASVIIIVLFAIINIRNASTAKERAEKYSTAIDDFTLGNYIEAKNVFRELGDYEDSKKYLFRATIATAKKGDIIEMGRRKWIVLATESDKVLVISKEIIIKKAMTYGGTDYSWSSSHVRTYLNKEFLNNEFNEIEKSCILYSELKNDYGNNTIDKVFLLSVEEVEKYFPNVDDEMYYPHDSWWTRTRKYEGTFNIDNYWGYMANGELEDFWVISNIGVRPAMWISGK